MDDHGTFDNTRLPADLQARVESELDKGERLLWVGQPNPGRLSRQAVPLVFVGIFFTGFALFWIALAGGIMGGFNMAAPGGFDFCFACFPLFGIPFVLVGLMLLTAPLWAARRARSTCYAVTDRRAILWNAGWFGSISVRSFRPPDLTRMQRVEYADGTGNLIFQEFYSWNQGNWDNTTNMYHQGYWQRNQIGFMAIDRVREVEEIIRRVLLAEGNERKV